MSTCILFLAVLASSGENNEPTHSLGMGGSSSPVVLYSARSWCLVWANLTGDRTARAIRMKWISAMAVI